MRRIIIPLLPLFLIGCTHQEYFCHEPIDGLIDVTFTAGTQHSSSKVSIGWDENENLAYWSSMDSIGIFAGSGNVNRKFILSSAPDMTSGTFSGQMMPVSTPTPLYAYFPYTPGATQDRIPFPAIQQQVFEGTFAEKGEFNNFGRYAFMFGELENFTIQTKWPDKSKVNFGHYMGIVRFNVSNSLDKAINVRSLRLYSKNKSLVIPKYMEIEDYDSYPVTTAKVTTITSSISDKNILELEDEDTAYPQMVVYPNSFKTEDSLNVVLVGVDRNGVNLRYILKKKVTKSNSFQAGKRTTITVPLTTDLEKRARRVKVTTSSATFTAPIFRMGQNYSAGDAVWGYTDTSWGVIEQYAAGKSHTFSSSGEHTSSFNHWGNSPFLTFENLKGIKAIDFTDVY